MNEANDLVDSKTVRYILLTSSNLPARLISLEGAIEIVPPDFKTINANGAGDTTAAYIAAFGVEDLIPNIKKRVQLVQLWLELMMNLQLKK